MTVSSLSSKSAPSYQQIATASSTISLTSTDDLDDHNISGATIRSAPATISLPVAFWFLGILNNASWVIMVACAKSISEGGTALVFLANTIPAFGIKASAPYWFDKVSYRIRFSVASVLMAAAFIIVASFIGGGHGSTDYSLGMQLLGVACMSAQCGLGEASLLALAGKCDALPAETRANNRHTTPSNACLTCFSSGTGLAGVFGFLWKFVFNDWLGISLRLTLWLALTLSGFYFIIYYCYLWNVGSKVEYSEITKQQQQTTTDEEMVSSTADSSDEYDATSSTATPIVKIEEMDTRQRMELLLSLWPYMVPLFLVYVAEYALQAGTWTAIGFPVDNVEARNQFYEYSNWMVSQRLLPS